MNDCLGYIPIAGTGGYDEAWVVDPTHAFARFMAQQGFAPIRRRDGRPFRPWSTDLNGLRSKRDWIVGGDYLWDFLEYLPYKDRNVIAVSHGGQVAIYCAALRQSIRTLTTVGTPVRGDVPADAAVHSIGYWQHLHDKSWDKMALLGQLFDRRLRAERWYPIPGVQNHGLRKIGHWDVIKNPDLHHYWIDQGWLEAIRHGPLGKDAA